MLVLTTLVAALATSVSAAPTSSSSSSSCTSQSSQVRTWFVKDFDFHASYIFTTPAHQNSWGYVNFTLANAALDQTAQCSASSDQLSDFFYGNVAYNCTTTASSSTTDNQEKQKQKQQQEATFSFSRPQNHLAVNQTWSCLDENSRFWAEGGADVKLDCKDETWQNPEWKVGQIYSSRTVTCQHLDVDVPFESWRGVA